MDGKTGRKSRRERTIGGTPGSSGTSSVDFIGLANRIYELSAREARSNDGNVSEFALAGIPMVFSATRCLLIEMAKGVWSSSAPREDLLLDLAGRDNDVAHILRYYSIPSPVEHDLKLLLEIRHEIIHPAHLPGESIGNTPLYIVELRERGLFNTLGTDADYRWTFQMQSHRLFRWAMETMSAVVTIVIAHHRNDLGVYWGSPDTFYRYSEIDKQIFES